MWMGVCVCGWKGVNGRVWMKVCGLRSLDGKVRWIANKGILDEILQYADDVVLLFVSDLEPLSLLSLQW